MLQITIYWLIFDKTLKNRSNNKSEYKRNVYISRGWFGLYSTYYTIYYRQSSKGESYLYLLESSKQIRLATFLITM